ncbi:transcription termination/antitermination factor NusG [Candidatus Babeliales bacterium]|nr:transcription termination/antitermination factor NusG [Candidatus Babeliales bacterium]
MKRWYVVQVYTGFEEVVKLDLEKRITAEVTKDLFGEVLIPSGETTGFWAEMEESETKREKIFPGYVLVQMEMVPGAYNLVMSTPRVYKFLGGEQPMPLSDKEVERIFSQIEGKIVLSDKQLPFGVGSEVNIASGPFAGFVGIVEKIDEEHKKLTVMVSIFGRLTPVELGFDQVKK